jgi:outer membrane protein assembly factor BamD (BamD/ComL family)
VEVKAGSSADLSAELGAIDKARSALAGGDASGALSQLDAYSRTYPRGRLALEAEVLRIDALARSGQRDAARKRAELFVRRHPNSVLKARVQAYLGE